MTAVIRLVFTGLCVGWVLQIGAPAAKGERPRDPAAQRFPEEVSSCAACHRETHEEWKASMHRGSWTTSLVQDRLHRMKEDTESCAGCHAATPTFAGFAAAPPLQVFFAGGEGNNQLILRGSMGDDVLRLYPARAEMSGPAKFCPECGAKQG